MMIKTITIALNPISVIVEGENEAQLLKRATLEVLRQMGVEFPKYKYSISEADCLTMQECKIGKIVETIDEKILRTGIIYAVKSSNSLPVSIVTNKGIRMSCKPQFLKESAETFENARCKISDYCKEYGFQAGDSGYVKINNEIKKVIIGASKGKNFQVFDIDNPGKYYTILKETIDRSLKDSIEDVK